MPAHSLHGQPDAESDWFASPEGRALLDSEDRAAREVLQAGPNLPWLWFCPPADPIAAESLPGGLRLHWRDEGRCDGALRGELPLPLASASVGSIVLQHVLRRDASGQALLDECERLLIPGGRLLLFALNPLAPYRWRWRGSGLQAVEPLVWRRRLREAGLAPEPVSHGIGPQWRARTSERMQNGAGLRAAYLLRAEKRRMPLTPVRAARPAKPALVLTTGFPAA